MTRRSCSRLSYLLPKSEGAQMKTLKWLRVACLSASLLIASNLGAQSVLAADADKGKRIAQSRCAPCHTVVPMER